MRTPEDEILLRIARQTLDQGLNFSRTDRITRATDDELLSYAHALFDHMVKDACNRVLAHVDATSKIARLGAAQRAGVTDEQLGSMCRKMINESHS